MRLRSLLAIGAFAALGMAAVARAGASGGVPGNLLTPARLIDSLDVRGGTPSLFDGRIATEGASSKGTPGLEFLTAAASLTFDLGAETPIAAVYVQADGRHRYSLQVSSDGEQFDEVWATPIPEPGADGRDMRSRYTPLFDVRARYVRFGEPSGWGGALVSEILLYEDLSAGWPPRLTVVSPAVRDSAAGPATRRFTRHGANQVKCVLSFLGAALLLWGWRLKRAGTPERHRRLRDGALLALGILGLTGYFNWGGFHFSARVHLHEFFHYYVGAKYFPELGYTRLYECASLAEAEQGFRRRVERRTIRNLTENERVSSAYVLDDPERWKQGFLRPFTPERWEAFQHDIAYFRSRMDIKSWEGALSDHGYNPSPAWGMAATVLANLGPASDGLIDGALAWIDPLLLLATFGMIAWAFGWRIACVAALFFGTNQPALYFWTGGAFLRQDWFFLALGGICLLRKGKPALGGAALAYSTLLRAFPAGFFVGIGMKLLWVLLRERRLDRTGLRIVIGAAVAVAILVPASSMVAGGGLAWPEFVRNTKKHADTPLTNNMGLRTLVSFRWDTRQKMTYDPRQDDPFHAFREARKVGFRGPFGWPLFAVLAAGYLALLFVVVRREMEWWALAAFGFGVVPVFLEMTCYYYSFLTAAALLGARREVIPIGLVLLAGLSQVIEFQTFYYDIRYFLESGAAIAFVFWATWVYGRRPAVETGSSLAPNAAAP